jgi:predicted lipase
MRYTVRIGSILEVKLGQEKAQFRVVWVGHAGTRRQGEIGLAKLAAEPQLLQFQSSMVAASVGTG